MRAKWLTEKEICDELVAKNLLREVCGYDEILDLRREIALAHGYRPDFLCFESTDGAPTITAIEVKITADAYSVAQLTNYINLIESFGIANRADFGFCPQVSGVILARYFDKSALALIESRSCIQMCAYRIVVPKSGSIALEYEFGDSLSKGWNFDPFFEAAYKKAFKGFSK